MLLVLTDSFPITKLCDRHEYKSHTLAMVRINVNHSFFGINLNLEHLLLVHNPI